MHFKSVPSRIMNVLAIAALASAVPAPAWSQEEQSPEDCPEMISLTNGSFEAPEITREQLWQTFPEDDVPGWQTTASDEQIKLQENGFFDGREAQDGTQWAELNATEIGSLYQDLETTPGSTMEWALYHRGKDTEDTMSVSIGDPDGTLEVQQVMTDGPEEWVSHTGTYTVPEGQTLTRFSFDALSGRPNIGNELDDVQFATESCVQLDKTVENLSRDSETAHVGDTLEYTVTAVNHGGLPAEDLVVTDPVPENAAYVPGSLTVDGETQTDDVADDLAENDADELTFRIGDGADEASGGSLGVDEGATITFQVTVTDTPAVANSATSEYSDRVTASRKDAVSNTIVTETDDAPVEPTDPPATAEPAASGDQDLPTTGISWWTAGAIAALLLTAGVIVLAVTRARRAVH